MFRVTNFALLLALLISLVGCSGSPALKLNSPGSGSNPPGPPTPSSVISIIPASETLRIGGHRQFSGFDSGVGQFDVTWSLKEGATAGTVTVNGLYTASDTPGTYHLIAASSHNTDSSAIAPVTVVNVGFDSIGGMATARAGHTASLLLDGRVLVAGGTADGAHSAELFLPATGTFTLTSGAMVHVRSGHCASLLQDGRVLIAGGGDSSGNLFKTAELFEPATQSFTAVGDLHQERTGATATLLANGKVLVAGGQNSGGTVLSSAELYDPSTGTFALTGNTRVPHAQHTATLLANGKVLLLGSIIETGTAELFDPATGLFTDTGSMIHARANHTATLLPNGAVLVLGGTQIRPPVGGGAPAAAVSIDSTEVYDPGTGVFHIAGKLLVARDSHSATLLPNGTVLVGGGYSHTFDGDASPEWYSMSNAEIFDPASSISTKAASLEVDRAGQVATMLNDGQLLITGGTRGALDLCCFPTPRVTTLAAAELYR
jgi:Galactose oxidase, central domain